MNSGINPKEKDYELARENTVAMNCHFLVCGIISIAYFVDFLKGDGTLLYVLATIILAMGPVVGEIICYKKQHDTKMIKHFVGIGYAILYTFVMFTTNNHFTFVYVIPMLIAITVYNDFKYSLPIEVGVVIVNVIQLALFFKRGIYTKADMASVEIQFFVIVLICGIQLYVSIVAEKLNQKKLAELKAEHEKTEELLTRIMDTSDKMTQQITESAQKTASLGESMQAMKESMEEVNSGSNDTAEAVQSQLNQTEEIQAMVEQVEKGTENIFDSMKKVHGMGARERLLLQIAALLHDCGKYISMEKVSECSYQIIMSTDIIGLSSLERQMIACAVRFNNSAFVYYDELYSMGIAIDRESYIKVVKMTAILRLANAMDRSHYQKVKGIKAVLKDRELQMIVDSAQDISLELGLLKDKEAFFEEVFGIRLVLRRKGRA